MLSKLSLTIGLALSYDKWDYSQNGADWPYLTLKSSEVNYCMEKTQSPINLETPSSPTFNYTVYTPEDDNFTFVYSNQYDEKVKF